MERYCKIVNGGIETESGAGDGAYDLLGVSGTPEAIGKAIAESLKESDLMSGRDFDGRIGAGEELYMTLRIKFAAHPLTTDE